MAAQTKVKRTTTKQFESTHLANIEKLDEYIEQMYSDNTETKVQAARHILHLSKEPENVEYMLSHESLFGVLARTLRDEHKTSVDLTTLIAGVFFIYSNYSQFHPLLSQNQVGDATMKVIEYQIKRHEVRKKELQAKEQEAAGNQVALQEVEKEQRKMEVLEKKQNKLLHLTFSILLNLAEDLMIERKMKKRKIVSYLVRMLERDSVQLLLVVLTFLKKLSIFGENKTEMCAEEGLVERLQRFVPCPHHQPLCNIVLKLIKNLTFDSEVRKQMDLLGYIPRIVSLLKEAPFRGSAIEILYQLSIEDKCKSTFTYTECIPIINLMIINFPEQFVREEIMALAINLATNQRNAEIFSYDGQLDKIVRRSLKCSDVLLIKLVRNISCASNSSFIQETLEQFSSDFIQIICDDGDPNFQIEVLGVLTNIELDDGWAELLRTTPLLDYIMKHLVIGYAEDDFILECIILVGTILSSDKCAQVIANSMVIKMLHNLLSEKQEDDEIVLQIMFDFYKMLLFQETRTIVLEHTQVIKYLMELLQDKNPRIRKMADSVMELAQEFDSQWTDSIRLKRFQMYNQEWLSAIEQLDAVQMEYDEEGEGDEDEDDDMQWEDGGDLANRMWGNSEEDY